MAIKLFLNIAISITIFTLGALFCFVLMRNYADAELIRIASESLEVARVFDASYLACVEQLEVLGVYVHARN